MSLFSTFFTPHGKKPWFLTEIITDAAKGYKFHVKRGSEMLGKAGAGTIRGGVVGLATGAKEGFFPAKTNGKAPWWTQAPKAWGWKPPSGKNIVEGISLPDIPKDFIKFPDIKLPDISIPSGIIQVGKLPDISMGADILGGIELPDVDAFSFRDEDGEVNLPMVIAMAGLGYIVLKKVK